MIENKKYQYLTTDTGRRKQQAAVIPHIHDVFFNHLPKHNAD